MYNYMKHNVIVIASIKKIVNFIHGDVITIIAYGLLKFRNF